MKSLFNCGLLPPSPSTFYNKHTTPMLVPPPLDDKGNGNIMVFGIFNGPKILTSQLNYLDTQISLEKTTCTIISNRRHKNGHYQHIHLH